MIMQQDAIDVFCLSHGVSFQAPSSNRVITCNENHVLSANFPTSGRWFYCCLCHKYWVAPDGEGVDAFPRQCPSCKLIKKPHYYSCDQCNVTMIDSQGSGNREGAHITPWGTPHPHCPGCRQLPKSIPQSHMCPLLNGLLTTARRQCPFCEGQERADKVGDQTDFRSRPATAIYETAIIRVGSSNDSAGLDPDDLDLEELVKKASAIRALEAEAEARVAKAQEKLLQVEASLRLEMSRRLELERKTQEIVLELKNQQEIDQNRIAQDQVEAERITSEAAARFEEERGMRVAAEQAKAEAETKLTELEARLIETEERLRQANSELQQERLKLTKAQERADELEVQLIAEAAKSEAEAEGKIQEIRAEARRVEENYMAEINRFRGEQEMALKAAEEAEENHKTEIARITADAELRTQQAEAEIRQKLQIKVDETIAAQEAIRAEARRVEENYRVEINRFRDEQEMAMKAAEEAEENHKTEIARITADAESRTQQAEAEIRQQLQIKVDEAIAAQEAIKAEARRLEENYRVEINRFRDEQEMAMKAAGEAEENHKTEIVRITAEAESRTQQAEAEIRRQLQIKIDEAIASAQDAMFKLEETQKKLDEAEARCQGMDSRARQAETQLRQINLIQRMNSALIGQVIEGSLKTSDKNGPESLPFDLPAEVNEILNALFMPEDLSVPEGLRDLPDDSESPTMSVDDHSVDITDIASPIDESAQSPPLWGLD